MAITHPVLLRSKEDYNPTLAKVNDDVIRSLQLDLSVAKEDVQKQFDFLKTWKLEDAFHYIFGLNSINFKFWELTPSFVRYSNNGKVGALAANEGFHSLYMYMQENKFNLDLLTPELMAEFYGDIPNVEERIQILKESLNPAVKLALYVVCMKSFKQETVPFSLADKIVEMLPLSYEDPYFKKVQLAIYEAMYLWNEVKGTNVSMPELTVAADYQLPKALEGMGVITYGSALKNMIESHKVLERDSAEELAIRSATIVACEKMRRFHNLSVPELDRFLWLIRNDFNTKFHLVDTTDY